MQTNHSESAYSVRCTWKHFRNSFGFLKFSFWRLATNLGIQARHFNIECSPSSAWGRGTRTSWESILYYRLSARVGDSFSCYFLIFPLRGNYADCGGSGDIGARRPLHDASDTSWTKQTNQPAYSYYCPVESNTFCLF